MRNRRTPRIGCRWPGARSGRAGSGAGGVAASAGSSSTVGGAPLGGVGGMAGTPIDPEITRRYTWQECGRIPGDVGAFEISSLDIDASGSLLVSNAGVATAWRVAEPFETPSRSESRSRARTTPGVPRTAAWRRLRRPASGLRLREGEPLPIEQQDSRDGRLRERLHLSRSTASHPMVASLRASTMIRVEVSKRPGSLAWRNSKPTAASRAELFSRDRDP
jgi:hypothetical protein